MLLPAPGSRLRRCAGPAIGHYFNRQSDGLLTGNWTILQQAIRRYPRSVIERDVRDVARVKDANDLARLLEFLALRGAHLLNVSHRAK